jgi:O-antigen ligase
MTTERHHRFSDRDHPQRSWQTLEKLVFGQLAVLVVATTWAYGGQTTWARTGLLAWGTFGMLLFVSALYQTWPQYREEARRRVWLHLWPLMVFDLLAVAACFNPSFQTFFSFGEPYYKLAVPPHAWLPSSARPDLTWRELWQFNAIVLSCYNLVLVFRRRRLIRTLLLVVCVNAVVLAVFGTFQKFSGASGPWFGILPSKQIYFFSTFVYHNHWGAFILLVTGAGLGLVFRAWQRGDGRDFWHSPVLAGVIGLLLLATTIPLSGSRSSTLLLGLLLGGALLRALTRLIRLRRAAGRSVVLPVSAVVLCAVLGFGAIGYLGKEMIAFRARMTATQFSQVGTDDSTPSRIVLYRDTWRMAMEKPWFGWGLETYGDVFRIYNSLRADEVWFGQPHYREAHSDWLQSLAESGFVGTGLLVLLGAIPLWPLRRKLRESVLPRHLLVGCSLVLVYAWLEFPFANPAVMIAFWLCLYAAVRYVALDAERR